MEKEFDDKDLDEDSQDNGDSEEDQEELENIIEDTQVPSFKQHALEEIIPSLSSRETQTLEQTAINTEVEKKEDNNQPQVYESQAEGASSYETGSDYFSSNSYLPDQPSQGSSSFGSIPDQFSEQPFQRQLGRQEETFQDQRKQYQTDIERKLKEERKKF